MWSVGIKRRLREDTFAENLHRASLLWVPQPRFSHPLLPSFIHPAHEETLLGRAPSPMLPPGSGDRCQQGWCPLWHPQYSVGVPQASAAQEQVGQHHRESGVSGRGSWVSACPQNGSPPGQRGSWATWYFSDSRRIPVSTCGPRARGSHRPTSTRSCAGRGGAQMGAGGCYGSGR